MNKRCVILSVIVSLLLTGGATRAVWAGIQAVLENPGEDQFVSGVRLISGWAFAVSDDPDNPVALPVTIQLSIDGQDYGEIPCCVDRRDVQEEYGEHALKSGFGQVFNFGELSGIGEGPEERGADQAKGQHTVRITISAEGVESEIIEHPVTVVRPAGYTFLELPSLIGSTSHEINPETQELMLQNVTFRDKHSNERASGELWLAWQPNIQQLAVVGSRIVATGEDVAPIEEDETADGEEETTSEENETSDGEEETAGSEDEVAVGEDDTADENAGQITAVFENPPPLEATAVTQVTAGGIGLVSGWAFTRNPDAEIDRVSLRIDGDTPIEVGEEIPCCSDRPDVKDAFPAVAPPNTGFGGLINFNLIPSGARTIGVEIRDTADPAETRIFDHEVSVVRLGDAELLDDFKLTEESSITVTGSLLTLQDVDIKAKGEDETITVDAGFLWNESCQCFLPWPLCGNGGRDVGEECDREALGELSCQTLGFGEGDLSCFRDEETDHDFCLLDTSACGEETGARAYVTLVNDNAVAVVRTDTNEVTQTIPVGDRPRGIAVSPDGNEVYVANAGDDNVSVINTDTKTVVATIPVGDEPQGVAFASDGATVYVTNIGDNNVSVIDTATRTQTTAIEVGRSPQSIAVAVTPDGPRAYVPNFDDNTVTVIDLTTHTPLPDPLAVGEGPLGVAVSVDGMRVYVANFGAIDTDKGDDNGDTVSFIDTAMNEVIDTNPDEDGVQHLQVGVQPAGIAVIPGTAMDLVKRELKADAFVANFLDATVSVITEADINPELSTPSFNVAFNPRFNAVDNEPYAIAITPNGLRGYVTLFGSRKDEGEVIQVFSTLGQQVVDTIEVGKKPFAIAIGPQ